MFTGKVTDKFVVRGERMTCEANNIMEALDALYQDVPLTVEVVTKEGKTLSIAGPVTDSQWKDYMLSHKLPAYALLHCYEKGDTLHLVPGPDYERRGTLYMVRTEHEGCDVVEAVVKAHLAGLRGNHIIPTGGASVYVSALMGPVTIEVHSGIEVPLVYLFSGWSVHEAAQRLKEVWRTWHGFIMQRRILMATRAGSVEVVADNSSAEVLVEVDGFTLPMSEVAGRHVHASLEPQGEVLATSDVLFLVAEKGETTLYLMAVMHKGRLHVAVSNRVTYEQAVAVRITPHLTKDELITMAVQAYHHAVQGKDIKGMVQKGKPWT
ncbi:MAG: hypothetical protein D6746_11175 [Bacteroidetes bacterium]|nr:MAG: hypothetical protein D6746_11175 [Bacteroidota bacterium]